MILTPSDIARIEGLGYSLTYFAVKSSDGFYRLRNVDGHCVFYDPSERRCIIYPWRPLGCRVYPIIYDLDGKCITVDLECPMAHTVTEKDIERARPIIARILRELGLHHIVV